METLESIKMDTESVFERSTIESETPMASPTIETQIIENSTIPFPNPMQMDRQFWPKDTPSPAMSYEMIPRNNAIPKKKKVAIEPVFYDMLDHCIALLNSNINKNDLSVKNICKIYHHIIRYIHNIVKVKEITDKASFDEFLLELTSGDYLKSIKENAEKVVNEFSNDTIFNGPIAEYIFPDKNVGSDGSVGNKNVRDFNYIIACTEFICCQILYSFKNRSNNDIERLINKLSVDSRE